MTYLKHFCFAILCLCCLVTKGQQNQPTNVPMIDFTPVIDGVLDKKLRHLEPHGFNHFWQFDNPVTDTVQVTYRLAYTPKHLYVYIETESDHISYHRRGHVWGDGYKLLLGIPISDGLTPEFYELNYSPAKDTASAQARQRIGTFNGTQIFKKLSAKSQSQERAIQGKSGFEALIAWNDIPPYHPWLLPEMGYNLYFAKGISSKEYGYFTNGYAVVEDEGIWDEEILKRNYKRLAFESPQYGKAPMLLSQVKQQHLLASDPIILEIAGTSRERNVEVSFELSDSTHQKVFSGKRHLGTIQWLARERFEIDIPELPIGNYTLKVQMAHTVSISKLSILPKIDFKMIAQHINTNKYQLSLGTRNTLMFKLNKLKHDLEALYWYETGSALLDDWAIFKTEYQSFLNGNDPYMDKTDPYRRAFRSVSDNTYQPYTLKLPKDYDSSKKYPLLVFLHGSGQDEQNILDLPRSNGSYIELAPFARDKYYAFAHEYSQKDIMEAIGDVQRNFSVNDQCIVIAGFSMGGYGALRTFYENPGMYKGVAVFAGHPNLANEWMDGHYPNFLDDNYLKVFKGVPVFIYHGDKDAGLDINLMKEAGEKLEKVGAELTLAFVPEKGHQYPDEPTNELYFEWLKDIANKNN